MKISWFYSRVLGLRPLKAIFVSCIDMTSLLATAPTLRVRPLCFAYLVRLHSSLREATALQAHSPPVFHDI